MSGLRARALVVAALLGAALAVGLRLTAASRGLAAAQGALDAGNLAAAETAWRGVLAADPGRADALYGLGWTLHLAGSDDLARDAFQQCVDAHPESPLGYKGLGSVAMSSGNLALAKRRFEEALERAPGDVAIRHSLGLLALSGGTPDDALATFEALVAENPDGSAFRQALAEARLAAGHPEEAVDDASAAVKLAGDDARAAALAHFTRARAILAASAGRVDPSDCGRTAPPVLAWLDEADRALDRAELTGVPLPDLVNARRAVRHRRGAVDDTCPGARADAGQGRKFPDG